MTRYTQTLALPPIGWSWVLRIVQISFLSMIFVWSMTQQADATTARIKDIVTFEGVRDNMLMGYGLVVGLNGTGDKIRNNKFTEESLVSFMERLGVNTRGADLKSRNVAAVTVTSTLKPFSRGGTRVDVTVSAMGDAKSLQGGTLLATPLYGADGEVYAVAQGPVAIGGFQAGGDAQNVVKGVPTSGFISDGAIVERETPFALNDMQNTRISLRNPDTTTAHNVANAINEHLGPGSAEVLDPATIALTRPRGFGGNMAGLMAEVENLRIDADQPARIVIDESTGTVVIGENVRISTVAVAQGNLTVNVQEDPQVALPGAFAPEGTPAVAVPRTNVGVTEGGTGKVAMLESAPTLRELVDGLNALGVGPRDLITILQAIKASGALQAEIEAR
ncbi:flagellar basal body P-ring protein FlgI [bacterium]|nr:flagellar basal body P-ring protein FlgI [bacterium]